jgi:hypothetical protein
MISQPVVMGEGVKGIPNSKNQISLNDGSKGLFLICKYNTVSGVWVKSLPYL